MTHVQGRVALVTGASSGIGEALGLEFARAGAKVVLAARRQDRLDQLASRIAQEGGEALSVAVDVTDEAAVQRLFAATLERFGQLDILVNNAGIADHTAIDQLTLERWRQVLDVNLTSAFLCAREAMRIMKGQGRGRIVNIGSISARTPRPTTPAYTASKHGLDGLTHALAVDGREHGVAVSILHPGAVATELVPGMSDLPADSYIAAGDLARSVLAMVDLPDHVNFYEGLILPLNMPYLGRG